MTTKSNSTSTPPKLHPGQKLAGCYLLESPLEAGGKNSIWIAKDEVLGKEVSLHFLPSAVSQDSVAIEALRHEIKRNRALIHPGVLRVYDLVEGEGWTAVAMDSFDARCLAVVVEEKVFLEIEDVEPWLDQICVTLEEAHRIKLTHRDLAPANIFVTSGGRLLLANFGTSRLVQDCLRRAGDGAEAPRLHNLSPQLLGGDPPSPTDDVYGVGALLFELLGGRPVFVSAEIEDQIQHTVAPRLSDVRDDADHALAQIPPGWENVISACLNKDPVDRPHRPSEIISSIEAYAPLPEPTPAADKEAVKISEEEALGIVPPVEVKDEAASEPLVPVEVLPVGATATVSVPEPELPEPVVESSAEESVQDRTEHEAFVLAKEEPQPSLEAEPADTIAKTEPAPFTPRPIKYKDAEEDAFSTILPRRFRFPAAVIAAVILVLALVNHFFKESKEPPTPTPAIATSDPADRAELTSVKNSVREPSAPSGKPTPGVEVQPIERKTPDRATEATPIVVAAAPVQKATPPVAAPAVPVLPGDKQIVEKTAVLERLKQELADAENAQKAKLKEQQAADTAAAEAKKAIEEKGKAAAAARKAADDLLVLRKKRQEDQKAADLAAQAAQQLAAEKVRSAEEARKALADFEAQNREKLTMQDQSDAEIQALQRKLAEQQKLGEENAKAAAAADLVRQQKLAALQQSEQELAQARAVAAKAADEDRRRQSVNSERQKLDDEIAAMRALFEQKMKDIEERRRQIESAPSSPAASAVLPATAELKPPAAVATPPPTLPLMASKTDAPKPPPASTPAPVPAPPSAAVGSTNSLGMRFVPVGDVFFCVWQTRVKDFEAFANSVKLKSTAWRGPGFRQGPDHPVVNVTWNEVIAFCKWLTDKERKEGMLPANQFYRLPYDLEWSKAVGLVDETGKTAEARDMGVPDVYPWGTDWPPPKGAGNYTGEETGSDVAIKGYDDGFAWTAPVGSFPPNKIGLYDMGGNVWQWCMDSWNNESKAKVLRGASWYNGALKLSLLSSCRVHAAADSSTDNYGFRITRATEAAAARPAKK